MKTLLTLFVIGLCLELPCGFNLQGQSLSDFNYQPRPVFVAGISEPVISLNGTWHFDPNPSGSFWKTLKQSKNHWHDIQVPGEWEMQGYTVEPGTRVAYYRTMRIPADWKGNRVILRCDALYSDAHVYINGHPVGIHTGGFTPCEFDITEWARPGRINHLVIGLISESLADTLSSASQYAAHALGGIPRKITLFALPLTHLKELRITTDLDPQYRNATVNINFVLSNQGSNFFNKPSVRTTLAVLGDTLAQPLVKEKTLDKLQPGSRCHNLISAKLFYPKKWDPEHPNLYLLRFDLMKGHEVIETCISRVGVREIEVIGNQVFVNGMPVKLHGINRHEVHPLRGRSLTMKEWRTDARLFKEANINYIRTSHYPPAEEFIDLCDSIGFFVELESPHCWVGHGANTHWKDADPQAQNLYQLIRQQVLETVATYRNHPAVLIWSLANESAWGPNWSAVLDEVNRIDPTRPVSFHDQAYGGYNNYGSTRCQIANIHYPGPDGPAIARNFNRPLLFGEYAHLNTYNRREIVTDPGVRDAWGRGLEPMWEGMYASAGCLGGAIWSGIDDVFYLPSGEAVGYGEWGPLDGWRRLKPEYWHIKKIYSPVKIHVRYLRIPAPGQYLRIPVENRHLFTNLRELTIRWKLMNHRGSVVAQVPPRSYGWLQIMPPDTLVGGEYIELNFISPMGYEIDHYRLLIGREPEPTVIASNVKNKPQLLIQGDQAILQWGDNQWVVNALDGQLKQALKNNQPVITGGPALQMLPLTTGPCNTSHSLHIEPLNDLCSGWNGRITGTGTDASGSFIKVEGSYDQAGVDMTYRLDSSGWLHLIYTLHINADINPRQIGWVFDLPRDFEQLSWKRTGQWSVYPENHIGRTAGSVVPFPQKKEHHFKFGVAPAWPWEADLNPMGSNDFRATRDHLLHASLTNHSGNGLQVNGRGGHDAIRSWIGNGKVHLLVASFTTGGGDLFFSSHLKNERHPLKKGDSFSGEIQVRLY